MQTQVLDMAVRVLRRAREIISKPECWTQRAFARDKKGGRLPNRHPYPHSIGAIEQIVMDDRAVCWCPDGAIRKALAGLRRERYREIEWDVVQAHARMGLWNAFAELGNPVHPAKQYRPTLWEWNDADYMTHALVLDAFEVAIDAKEATA